jgi:hypothetical protein
MATTALVGRAALVVPAHDVKQPISFPRRILRPGFATLLHSPRIEGWAERRETFGCSGTRGARRIAARQAPSDPPALKLRRVSNPP